MTALLVFVSAFAALSASASAAGITELGLRGGRSLQQTPLCNSIGCPGGFIPIPDAQSTLCDSNPCEVSQCCQDSSDGNGDGDSGDGMPLCRSIGCPNDSIPIIDAQTTVCDADPCEASQCCDAFCAFHQCPNGFSPIDDARTTLCPDSGCTDDLCCDESSNGNGDGGGGSVDGTPLCNSIGCPNDSIPIIDAQTTVCDADPCEASQCCDAFCAFHQCPSGFSPIEDGRTTLCPDSGCTDDLCCDEV